jgi:hypothetical protein
VVGNANKHPAQLNIPFAMVPDTPANADSEVCGMHDHLIDSKLKGNAQPAFAEHLHSEAVDHEGAHNEHSLSLIRRGTNGK